MQRTTWNTYKITGYTHDIAQDQRSAGGVHLHQVRRTKAGHWQRRILQSNGRHQTAGPVEEITPAEGERAFATATLT